LSLISLILGGEKTWKDFYPQWEGEVKWKKTIPIASCQ